MVLRKRYQLKMLPLRLTDSVFNSINQKMHVGGIFCEVAKAFECKNREILLAKLYFCGI
jgi:hypothetical protein